MSDLFLAKLAIYEALPAHLPDISHFQTIFQQTAHSCSFSPGAFHDNFFNQTKARTWLSLASYAEPFHHAPQLFGEAFLDTKYAMSYLPDLPSLLLSLGLGSTIRQTVFLLLHNRFTYNISIYCNPFPKMRQPRMQRTGNALPHYPLYKTYRTSLGSHDSSTNQPGPYSHRTRS